MGEEGSHCLGLLVQGGNGGVGWAVDLGVRGHCLDFLLGGIVETGLNINQE